jgi:hypothetical protein
MLSEWKIRIIGSINIKKEEILERFILKGINNLLKLEGEYVIALESNKEKFIVSSPYGIHQYYYSIVNGELFHDDTVLGVLKKSDLKWKWNWNSLANLMQLDFVLENDTLHPDIKRLPAGSILQFRDNKIKITSTRWEDFHKNYYSTPMDALDKFNNVILKSADSNSVVSMSAGFDSRLILSSLLKNNFKPRLLTMGFDQSTDVVITKEIANYFNLPLEIIELNHMDYIKYGKIISKLTNGHSTAGHWHTYLYLKMSSLNRENKVLIGTNGEFARSFLFDKGLLAKFTNIFSPMLIGSFWDRKLHSTILNNIDIKGVNDNLLKEISDVKVKNERINNLKKLSYNSLLSGMDRFYLEQRVKNFMCNGVKLSEENVSINLPYMDREWINDIWNLDRKWKFGSNWHRFAINENCKNLMQFPTGDSNKIDFRAQNFYWLRKGNQNKVPYHKSEEWFKSDEFLDFIYQNSDLLSDLFSKTTLVKILEEQKINGNRTELIIFLFTILFWKINLYEEKIK